MHIGKYSCIKRNIHNNFKVMLILNLCLTCKTRLRLYVLTFIVRRCWSDIVTTFLYENSLVYFIYCAVFGYRFSSAGLKDIIFSFSISSGADNYHTADVNSSTC